MQYKEVYLVVPLLNEEYELTSVMTKPFPSLANISGLTEIGRIVIDDTSHVVEEVITNLRGTFPIAYVMTVPIMGEAEDYTKAGWSQDKYVTGVVSDIIASNNEEDAEDDDSEEDEEDDSDSQANEEAAIIHGPLGQG